VAVGQRDNVPRERVPLTGSADGRHPLMLGIGLLFFDGRSVAGGLLTLAGAAIILLGIIVNLRIYFEPTSLFNTLLMLAMLAAGLGLVARSLRAQG
jgi:uncharacterized protein